MNFTKRIAKLELLMVPKRQPRIVLRYEGPGSERFPQPAQEALGEARLVLAVQFVPGQDGRPMEPNSAAQMRADEGKMKEHGAKFGRKKEDAVAALLTHRSIDEAARSIGLNPNTLLRWLEIPEFRDAYRKARREAVQQAVTRLQQGTGIASLSWPRSLAHLSLRVVDRLEPNWKFSLFGWEGNSRGDGGMVYREIKRRGLIFSDNFKSAIAEYAKCCAFSNIVDSYWPIGNDRLFGDITRCVRPNANPRPLFNFEIVSQITPLKIGNNGIANASENSNKFQPIPPPREGFLFPPLKAVIPSSSGLILGYWGWTNLRRERRLPFSGFAFIAGIFLWIIGLYFLLPWGVGPF
ncbi:MAG TPA: hypothetical protein VMB85_18520 [Bryobacteraceae bacterium]|nr:hypothetical protein [Bryobacteraceae bacterium]